MSFERKSGLYQTTFQGFHFELRFDVDGDFPQNQVSVTLTNRFPSHWIADLTPRSSTTWDGAIWFRHGSADEVRANGQIPNRLRVRWFENQSGEFVRLTFQRNFQSLLNITLARESDFFRTVEFELDNETGVDVLTAYDTHDHPRRPNDLPQEALSLQDAFGRAGVEVNLTPGNNVFDPTAAGADDEWNSSELHDAMMANWSRPDGTPWSMWVVSASRFDNDPGFVTFGIMFDSIGSFHRNGTAVFNTSIEEFYPANHPNRAATIRRHKFRTLIHEIGHAFNLAHSWQKNIQFGSSWHTGVVNEPEARSFMNYPGRVTGGENAYWDDFRFRFSDQELEFIRHAPANFVAMAGEDWFQNHADLALDPEAPPVDHGLRLELRFQRPQPILDYLEPVRLELKLTNTTRKPVHVPSAILRDPARMNVFVTRSGGPSTQVLPYSQACYAPSDDLELKPGMSTYGELYLSSAANGWLVSEPGQYEVAVALGASCKCEGHTDDKIASANLTFFVRPPAVLQRREYERAAQDYFTEEVGRVLAFGGSRLLEGANDCLQDVSERLASSAAAVHAQLALRMPDMRAYKLVKPDGYGKLDLHVLKPRIEDAQACFQDLLVKSGVRTAETLGHLGFKQLSDKLCNALEKVKEDKPAASFQRNILKVLRARKAKLPKGVQDAIQARISQFTKK